MGIQPDTYGNSSPCFHCSGKHILNLLKKAYQTDIFVACPEGLSSTPLIIGVSSLSLVPRLNYQLSTLYFRAES